MCYWITYFCVTEYNVFNNKDYRDMINKYIPYLGVFYYTPIFYVWNFNWQIKKYCN